MKQEIINYQTDIIQKEKSMDIFPQTYDQNCFRYTNWSLQQTICEILDRHEFSIKWIGSHPNSHILAFFYCVFNGCLRDQSSGDNLFIKLKYNLYQEAKEVLPLNEQKIFVEHIQLAEYSKNIGEFMKKSRYLEFLLVKIFNLRRNELIKKNLSDSTLPHHSSKLQELQIYASSFPFFHFESVSEKCGKVTIKDQTFFIIQEKDCFFTIEDQGYSILSSNISGTSTYTRKIKKEEEAGQKKNLDKTSPRVYDHYSSKEVLQGTLTKETNKNNISSTPSFLGKTGKKNLNFTNVDEKKQLQTRKIAISKRYEKSDKRINSENVLSSIEELQYNAEKEEKSSKGNNIENKSKSKSKVQESQSSKVLNLKNQFLPIRTSLGCDKTVDLSSLNTLKNYKKKRERIFSISLEKHVKLDFQKKSRYENSRMWRSRGSISKEDLQVMEKSIKGKNKNGLNSLEKIKTPNEGTEIQNKKTPKFLTEKKSSQDHLVKDKKAVTLNFHHQKQTREEIQTPSMKREQVPPKFYPNQKIKSPRSNHIKKPLQLYLIEPNKKSESKK